MTEKTPKTRQTIADAPHARTRIHQGSRDGLLIVDIPGSPDAPETAAVPSKTLATVHRLASRLHEAGVLGKTTMREYDELCLTEVKPMGAQDIRNLRERAGVSQAVLARVLNVTTNAVGQWERGEKKPTGSALKLLALVREKGLGAVL